MKIRIRLSEVLDQLNDGGRGAAARICRWSKSLKPHQVLKRNQVSGMLNNRLQYVSLTTLAGICDYLVHRHRVTLVEVQEAPGQEDEVVAFVYTRVDDRGTEKYLLVQAELALHGFVDALPAPPGAKRADLYQDVENYERLGREEGVGLWRQRDPTTAE